MDVAGNQVSSKSTSSPLSITSAIQLTTGLTIEPSSNKTIQISETFTIKGTLTPNNANNKSINWTTSNSSIATISSNTSTTGSNITITGKSPGTTTITATPSDGQLAYSKSITVTVYTPILIEAISSSNYGDYINYPINLGIKSVENKLGTVGSETEIPLADWKIFYKDSTYTYIIASDFIHKSKFPSGIFANNGKYNGYWSSVPSATTPTSAYKNIFLYNNLSSVSTSNISYKISTYLVNTSKWTSFVNSTYANACIGSPTIEMLFASWNQKYPNQPLYFGINSTGYTAGKTSSNLNGDDIIMNGYSGYDDTLYFSHTRGVWNDCYGYMLASPTSYNNMQLWAVCNAFGLGHLQYNDALCGIRPVVALKSSINGYKDSNGIWQLEN